MTLTHKKKSGHSNNLPLKKNPNPTDAQKAYLRKQIVKDFKYNFSKAFKNMKISDEDAEIILNYLDKKRSSHLWWSLITIGILLYIVYDTF